MAYISSQHTISNKPIGIGQAVPTDGRTYYYQTDIFKYRPFQSEAEVLAYLDTPASRTGHMAIIINDGTLDTVTGEFTGGTVTEWWFKDGVADADLVEKTGGGGGFTVTTVDDL